MLNLGPEGGQVVSVLAFFPNNPSSNPTAGVVQFSFCKIVLKRTKINGKRGQKMLNLQLPMSRGHFCLSIGKSERSIWQLALIVSLEWKKIANFVALKKYFEGGSPGLVVMGDDSRLESRRFESRCFMLEGYFHICLLYKNCNIYLKRLKINVKEARICPIKKTNILNLEAAIAEWIRLRLQSCGPPVWFLGTAFMLFQFKLWWLKDENKQKEAGIGTVIKPSLLRLDSNGFEEALVDV